MYPELKGLSLNDLITRFRARKLRTGSSQFARDLLCDEIAFEIVSRGSRGTCALMDNISVDSEPKYRSALCALSSAHRHIRSHRTISRVARFLGSAFEDKRPLVKAEALSGLADLRVKLRVEHVAALLRSKNPYLASSALKYVCALYPQRSHAALASAIKSPHFLVREAALDEIDDRHLSSFLPKIYALLNDRHPHVRQAAETACANLAK